jgi:hypothetical protein
MITGLRTKAFKIFAENFVKENWHGILQRFIPQNVAPCFWHYGLKVPSGQIGSA